jgi:PAS domain S-box-containing protein
MNITLKEQISKCFGDNAPKTGEFRQFVDWVNNTYNSMDVDTDYEEHQGSQLNLLKKTIDATAAVTVCDNMGILLSVNDLFCELSGYKSESLVGQHVRILFPENSHLELNKSVQAAMQKGDVWNGECKMQTIHGKIYWVSITMVVQRNDLGEIVKYMSTMIDITSLKIYQEEVLNSEYKYKDVVNSVREIIFQVDEKSEFVILNSAWTDITGFSIADSLGMSIIDFVHEDQKVYLLSELNKLHNSKVTSINQVIRFITKDGRYLWFDFFARLMLRDDGELIGITGTMENITEKKKNEEILMNALAFNKALLDSAEQAIVATDAKGIINTFNTGAEKMLGYSASEVIGIMRLEQLHDQTEMETRRQMISDESGYEIAPGFATIIANSKRKSKNESEWIYVDSNMISIPVQLNVTAIRDDNGIINGYLSIANDITYRKNAEMVILKNEKKYRDLVDFSQGLICTHEKNGKLLSVNPAVCQTTGYSSEELIGKNLADFIPESYRELFQSKYLSAFSTEKISKGILAFTAKSGENIFLLYKNYLVEEPGEPSYVVGFAQDISDRIKMENDLKEAIRTAEDSAKAKELFLGNISHEIRTPMNGIVGLTNLLLKSDLSARQYQFAKSVKDSAENLICIVNDVLDLNKIQSGNLRLNVQPFDINLFLINISRTYQEECNQKSLEFIYKNEGQFPQYLMGDYQRINQIIVNLLGNAIKFTEKGQITFKVEGRQEEDNYVALNFSVKDTGIGIAPDKQKQVFNIFTQADTQSSRKFGGTGMGLTIVKLLLEKMGSGITMSSKLSEGSEFAFQLRLKKSDSMPMTLPELNHKDALFGKTILMAEDNKVNQIFAKELLREWGTNLTIVENGAEALEWLMENTCDIILMDIQMPVMDGIVASQTIRNGGTKADPSIPIIVITANARKGEEEKFIACGMQHIIFKPYDPEELFSAIVQALQLNSTPTLPLIESSKKSQKIEATNEFTFKYASLEVLQSFSRGKVSFMSKMLDMLTKNIPVTFTEMHKCCAIEDWEQLSRVAHKLIPNINMAGNEILENDIKWLEEYAVECKEKEKVIQRLQAADELMKKVIPELSYAATCYVTETDKVITDK